MSYDIEVLKKKELLRIEETAFWLDCSRATIYRLLEDGKLEGFRDGNRSRITRSSLEKYITSHINLP